MNPRNRFFILLGIIFLIALGYYFFSTPSNKDLVLIGTVDSNQVIVSPQIQGRLQKLLVDEGTPVKTGDLIAVIDPAELQAQEAAAARDHHEPALESFGDAVHGAIDQGVDHQRRRQRAGEVGIDEAQLAQAQATMQRTESDSRRTIELAKQGVASDQDRVQAETNLAAAQANVQSLEDQVRAAEADLSSAIARTHQAAAAQSTVASTQADLKNAEEQKKQAEVRLGYTNIYAPVTGTVSVRAARQGEVLNVGSPIVTIVDLTDTWVRAAIPETQADHIGLGDTLRVRLPGGTITSARCSSNRPKQTLRRNAT